MSQGNQDQAASPEAVVQTTRIINIALLMGVIIFLVIAFAVMRKGKLAEDPWDVTSLMTLASLVFAAGNLAASFLVPPLLTRRNVAQVLEHDAGDEDPAWAGWGRAAKQLAPLFQTELIIRLALIEGAAFFCVIAFMLEGTLPALIAALVLVGVMVWQFPSESSLRAWFDRVRG
jgi:hypothetical protein